MQRRAMVKASLLATGVLPRALDDASRLLHQEGQDEALLASARERINRLRKSTLVVSVRTKAGRAATSVSVKVEQIGHSFHFGGGLFRFGRGRTESAETSYRTQFANVFNFATLGFYWRSYEPVRGRPRYADTDRAVRWCLANGIVCKGHPLVWDYPDSVPDWLPQLPTDAAKLSLARVADCVARYRGQIDVWDVVNEPVALGTHENVLSALGRQLGAAEFTRLHLTAARAANPHAQLIVNDYQSDLRLTAILRAIETPGSRLADVIGIQSHMHDGPWPLERIWNVCDSLASMGMPIHFTETTVVSGTRRSPGYNWFPTTPDGEALQADYVARLYTMLFAHPAVSAVTWWDFSDEGAWQGAPAGWLRSDMSPKPVYDRLHNLIKGEWWTDVTSRTDSDGMLATQAVHGKYRVEVESGRGRRTVVEALVGKDRPNRVEIVLDL